MSIVRHDNRQTRSDTVSPSVGSFQVQIARHTKLTRLHEGQKGGQVPVEDVAMDAGQSSPKHGKGAQKNLDLDSVDEQVFTPRSVDNFRKKSAKDVTPPMEQAAEAVAEQGTPLRRGKSRIADARGPKSSPKQKRGMAPDAGNIKPSPKRKWGAQKISPGEELQMTYKVSRRMDEFEDNNDDNHTSTESLKEEGVEEGNPEDAPDLAESEDKSLATKSAPRKGRLPKAARKPVAERVSESKVTRAAKGSGTR